MLRVATSSSSPCPGRVATRSTHRSTEGAGSGTNDVVNAAHLAFLASPDWARTLETDLRPWIERVADDVIEIGPGPGLTTGVFREPTIRRSRARRRCRGRPLR
jgi:hypothetical protein